MTTITNHEYRDTSSGLSLYRSIVRWKSSNWMNRYSYSGVQGGCTYRKANDTGYQERDTFFSFLLPARDFRQVKSAEEISRYFIPHAAELVITVSDNYRCS